MSDERDDRETPSAGEPSPDDQTHDTDEGKVPKEGPVVGPTGGEGAPPDPSPERLGGGL